MRPDTPTVPAPRTAEIVREYVPFSGAERIHGITHDGEQVWAATGTELLAIDPASGQTRRRIACTSDAGTAFDGKCDAGALRRRASRPGASGLRSGHSSVPRCTCRGIGTARRWMGA
jgi:hypothetical protein